MNISEEWMVLPEYSNYFISNNGVVKRIRKLKRENGVGFKEIILKSRIINGYNAYTLVRDDGLKKTVYIHHAIATCFIKKPKTNSKLIVIHNDGNKINNNPDNLSWNTVSFFMKNEFETGRRTNKDLWAKRVKKYGSKGSLKPNRRSVNLSDNEKQNIYNSYYLKGFTLKKLALNYNCSISHIYNLLQKQKEAINSGKINKTSKRSINFNTKD
jgi:hypothetical protein